MINQQSSNISLIDIYKQEEGRCRADFDVLEMEGRMNE
jgi:hypothetical protein